MNDWKKIFCNTCDNLQISISQVGRGPVSNDVAHLVIKATHSLFLLAVEKTLLNRYVVKPIEVLDLCPLTSVTNLLLDELLVSIRQNGYQHGIFQEPLVCKVELDEVLEVDYIVEECDSDTNWIEDKPPVIAVIDTPNISPPRLGESGSSSEKTASCKKELDSAADFETQRTDSANESLRNVSSRVPRFLKHRNPGSAYKPNKSSTSKNRTFGNKSLNSEEDCNTSTNAVELLKDTSDGPLQLEAFDEDCVSESEFFNDDANVSTFDINVQKEFAHVGKSYNEPDLSKIDDSNVVKRRGRPRKQTEKFAQMVALSSAAKIKRSSVQRAGMGTKADVIPLKRLKVVLQRNLFDTIAASDRNLLSFGNIVSDENVASNAKNMATDENVASNAKNVATDENVASNAKNVATDENVASNVKNVATDENVASNVKNVATDENVASNAKVALDENVISNENTASSGKAILLDGNAESIENAVFCGNVMSEENDASEGEDSSYENVSSCVPALSVTAEIPSSSLPQIHVVSTNSKRKFDKRAYCLYCKKKFSKLSVHLCKMHSHEQDVMEIINSKSNKIQRLKCLKKLRNLGNHLHNCEVLRAGFGDLHVVRRPSGAADAHASTYVPCPFCFGYYHQDNLWKHANAGCMLKDPSKEYKRILQTAKLLLPTAQESSQSADRVLSLKDGPVKDTAESDTLILQLPASYSTGLTVWRTKFMNKEIRLISRLIIEMRTREKFNGCTLEDCLNPNAFSEIVSAVHTLAGYNATVQVYRKPSVVVKISNVLKKSATILRGVCVETRNGELIKKADEFIELCNVQWFGNVASNPRKKDWRKVKEKKEKKDSFKMLPVAEDICKLNHFLRSECTEAQRNLTNVEKLSREDLVKSWKRLAEVTLTQLMIFNRRQLKLVNNITVVEFLKRTQALLPNETYSSLSRIEKELCKIFIRIDVEGPRGQTVPVLLNSELQNALCLVVDQREIAGVSDENPYLFASNNLGSLDQICGDDCLRKFEIESGAQRCATLTLGNLSDYCVTMMLLIINMTDNELDTLAQLFGRDILVSRQFCHRLKDPRELANISKLFVMWGKGVAGKKILIEAGDELATPEGGNTEAVRLKEEEKKLRVESENETVRLEDRLSFSFAGDKLSKDITGSKECAPEQKAAPKCVVRKCWTAEEKAAIVKHLQSYIDGKILPGKKAIDKCLDSEKALAARTWRNVKDFVRNTIVHNQ